MSSCYVYPEGFRGDGEEGAEGTEKGTSDCGRSSPCFEGTLIDIILGRIFLNVKHKARWCKMKASICYKKQWKSWLLKTHFLWKQKSWNSSRTAVTELNFSLCSSIKFLCLHTIRRKEIFYNFACSMWKISAVTLHLNA